MGEALPGLLEQSRRFSLDVAPSLVLASGPMVETLVNSGVHRYCDFKSIEGSFLLQDDSLRKVPCSKNEVFADKQISLIEKRCLMKFLQLATQYAEDPQAAECNKLRGFLAKPFKAFLAAEKLSAKLQAFVLYAIAHVSTNQSLGGPSTVSTEEGMAAVTLYLKSFGKFGSSAFLSSHYGICELPQGFCRLCAVYGGIYVLQRGIQHLVVDPETNRCKGVLCTAGQTFSSPVVVCGPEYVASYHPAGAALRKISRCVCITDSSLFEDCSHGTITIPPAGPATSPIQVLQADSQCQVCPVGKYVVNFTCVSSGASAMEDLQAAVQDMLLTGESSEGAEASPKPHVLWGVYYEQTVAPDILQLPDGAFACPSTRPTLCNADESCRAAQKIFAAIYPEETFLEKVPDPEDDVVEFDEEPEPDLMEDSTPSDGDSTAAGVEAAAASIGQGAEGAENALQAQGEEGVENEPTVQDKECVTHTLPAQSDEGTGNPR